MTLEPITQKKTRHGKMFSVIFLKENEHFETCCVGISLSTDHSAGVQLLLCAHPRPLLPHHPGVPAPPAGRGGLHSARCLFSLPQPRPDAAAEPGEEGACRQTAGHRPGGLHCLLHAVPRPAGAGLLPGQSRRGGAGARGGARACLSHHGYPEQPEQLLGSSGLLLCDGQLQESVEDEEEGSEGGGRGGRAHKWGRKGEEFNAQMLGHGSGNSSQRGHTHLRQRSPLCGQHGTVHLKGR